MLGAPLAVTGSALARGGREQAELAGSVDRVRAAVYAELGVHVAQVGPDRVLGYEQLRRDLWPAEVGRQVAQHPKLALRQWFPQRFGILGPGRRSVSRQQILDLGDQRCVSTP